MTKNRKDAETGKWIGGCGRSLIVAACLAIAPCPAALAGVVIYNEGTTLEVTSPLVDLAAASNPGSTTVNGLQDGIAAEFEVTGLGTGTFTVTATSDGTDGDFIRIYNSPCFSGLCFIENDGFNSASPLMFSDRSIPASGDLFFLIQPVSSEGNTYSVTVNTDGGGNTVPEPSTVGLVALGFAAALTARWKRQE